MFLAGDNGMVSVIRAVDWSKSGLGSIDAWPQSFKTAVEIMLCASTPAAICWGPDFILLYNEQWSEFIGAKHPSAFGQPANTVLPDIWDTIGPTIEKVRAGSGSIQKHDQRLPVERGNQVEEAWFDCSFTPIFNDDGSVGGVFNNALETTQKVRAEEALKNSERRFGAYVSASADAVYTMSPDWEEMRSLQGHAFIPDLEGPSRSWVEKYIHPVDRSTVWSAINESIRTKSVLELEHRVIRVDGTLGWTHSRAIPLLDEDGEIVEWIGAAKDVTERKQTNEALKESNALLAAILEQMPFGLGVLGEDGRTILANQTMRALVPAMMPSRDPERRHRWRSVDAQGLPVPPERWPGARALRGERVSSGMEFTYAHKDGEESWMQVSAVPFRSAAGAGAGAIVVVQDISERKQVEETLHRREEEFRALVENAPDVISLFDRNLHRIYVNAEVRENTGQDASFMIGKSLTEAGYPDSFSQPLNAAIQNVFVTGSEETIEVDWEAPKGHIWLQIRCAPLRSADGSVEQVMSIGRDITDRKQAENQIKAALTEKEILLKEIHHRVKNNMQVISSLVDLQAHEVKDPAMHSILQDVSCRVRSMAMVHEKLYQSTDLARVDFADYCQSLLGYLWRALQGANNGIRLDLKLEPVLLPVTAAVPCGLILNELFGNALKHAFKGRDSGNVSVSLHTNGHGEIRLGVKDDGTGMPADVDWQNANSLGLRLVQMLARQLHATVDAQFDNGTTFTIVFQASEP